MTQKAHALRIGFFVLGGVALAVGGLFAFGVRSWLVPKTRFETYLDGDVSGLSVGSPVKFRGVKLGEVREIGLAWNEYPPASRAYVVVRMDVETALLPRLAGKTAGQTLDEQIAGGLRARVKGEGLTGTSIVSMEYVTDPARYPQLPFDWKPDYPVVPSAPSQFTQMLAALERTLANFEQSDMAGLIKRLDGVVLTIDGVATKLATVDVARVGEKVETLIAEVQETNRHLQGLVADARGVVAHVQTRVDDVDMKGLSADARLLLSEAGRTNARLQELIVELQGLDVGAVNDTLHGAREAAESLDEVLRDLKRYPSGFLLGEPPLPAAGVERKKK